MDLFEHAATARELADQGMKAASDHAEAVEQGWNDRAFAMLRQYASRHSEFMGEDVRVWAKNQGLPDPPDKRAWGSVIQRGARSNLISCVRYENTKIPPAHAAPRAVWSTISKREGLNV